MDGAMGTMLQQKNWMKRLRGQKCTEIPTSIRKIIENAKSSGIELKGITSYFQLPDQISSKQSIKSFSL